MGAVCPCSGGTGEGRGRKLLKEATAGRMAALCSRFQLAKKFKRNEVTPPVSSRDSHILAAQHPCNASIALPAAMAQPLKSCRLHCARARAAAVLWSVKRNVFITALCALRLQRFRRNALHMVNKGHMRTRSD